MAFPPLTSGVLDPERHLELDEQVESVLVPRISAIVVDFQRLLVPLHLVRCCCIGAVWEGIPQNLWTQAVCVEWTAFVSTRECCIGTEDFHTRAVVCLLCTFHRLSCVVCCAVVSFSR